MFKLKHLITKQVKTIKTKKLNWVKKLLVFFCQQLLIKRFKFCNEQSMFKELCVLF